MNKKVESHWLVWRRDENGRKLFYQGGGNWIRDPFDADRFASQEKAEKHCSTFLPQYETVCQRFTFEFGCWGEGEDSK